MKRRNLFLIILSLAMVAVLAVYGLGVVGNQAVDRSYMGPVHLKHAEARLTGGPGTDIMVAYETNESLGYALTANQTYLVLEKNGQVLHVEYVYKIGYLESFSMTGDYSHGWFMVHNYDRLAMAGDLVTVHVGGSVLEHCPLTPSQLGT